MSGWLHVNLLLCCLLSPAHYFRDAGERKKKARKGYTAGACLINGHDSILGFRASDICLRQKNTLGSQTWIPVKSIWIMHWNWGKIQMYLTENTQKYVYRRPFRQAHLFQSPFRQACTKLHLKRRKGQRKEPKKRSEEESFFAFQSKTSTLIC